MYVQLVKTTHCIPKHIRRLINKKKFYWSHLKTTGIIAYHRNYMNYNKICKKHINKHVNNKIQLLCSKNNLKAFYNYVNSSIGHTKSLICIKSKVNSEFLNDREAANEFAKFFHST